MQNNKKWMTTVLSILSLVLLGIFLYLIFGNFGKSTRVIDIFKFDEFVKQALASTSDDTFIYNLKLDEYYGTASFSFVQGGKAINYVANIGRSNATLWGSLTATVGENNAYGVAGGTLFRDILNNAMTKTGDANVIPNILFVPLPKEGQSIWKQLLISLLPFLVMVIISILMFRSIMKRSMNNMMGTVGENKNPAQKIKSDKTFKDIAGNKEAIEEIREIVDYLKNPKKYQLAGARMPHGILLGGPPGTGKTLLAKATAGEANVPFYYISASNFVELYVGLGAKKVRTVVEEARKNAPAIIFIDELDAIGRTRGAGLGGGHDEREQTLNQLLVEMDGMQENNGLLFFAATNRTDVLDPALTRPGRFDRSITVGLPDVKERQEILELHAKGKRLASDIQLAQVAKRTPGYSGAQLENVINEASLLAVRANSEVITREDIDEAIDRVMSGPAKKNRVISQKELTMVAYHEAGHAVVGIKIPGGNKVQKITIIPRGQAGGYNLMMPEEEKYNLSRNDLIAMITSYMGGRASEQIIYGKDNVSTGASDDIARATKIARKMVTEWGMSELGPIQYEQEEGSPFLGRDYMKSAGFSTKVGHEIDLEVRKIIMEAESKAIEVINENRELLELIKTALLEKETIVAEEIEYIAQNMKLPEKKEVTNRQSVNSTPDLDEMLNSENDKN